MSENNRKYEWQICKFRMIVEMISYRDCMDIIIGYELRKCGWIIRPLIKVRWEDIITI
jgi:hypothetical protein